MKLQSRTRALQGFTLIEIVITTALMSVVLASAYVCLNAGITSQKTINARSDVLQNARVALARISADLRAACPLSKDYDFLGMPRMIGDAAADNLDFATHNYSPRREQESDFCEVSYFVQKSSETGKLSLWRRRDPTPDDEPLAGGLQEQIAEGLLGLRFEYYDGFDWYAEWGDPTGKRQTSALAEPNVTGMPEAVRITLFLDASLSTAGKSSTNVTNEPPMVFQTIARLNLAATATSSATSSSSASPDSGNNQPQPGAMNFPGGPQ